MIICPACRGRATKLVNISWGTITCQQCGHSWECVMPEPVGTLSNERLLNMIHRWERGRLYAVQHAMTTTDPITIPWPEGYEEAVMEAQRRKLCL